MPESAPCRFQRRPIGHQKNAHIYPLHHSEFEAPQTSRSFLSCCGGRSVVPDARSWIFCAQSRAWSHESRAATILERRISSCTVLPFFRLSVTAFSFSARV